MTPADLIAVLASASHAELAAIHAMLETAKVEHERDRLAAQQRRSQEEWQRQVALMSDQIDQSPFPIGPV